MRVRSAFVVSWSGLVGLGERDWCSQWVACTDLCDMSRPLCAMGSPEPASMVRSVLSRYICEHVPSLYTSRAAAAREPIRT